MVPSPERRKMSKKDSRTLEMRFGDPASRQVSTAIMHFLQHFSVFTVGPRKMVKGVTVGITVKGEVNA